jgi:uncharacterized protein
MTITMYALTVPVFARYLDNLDAILATAEANATERKIKPEVLGASRLAPDMLPLSFQVQSATDRMKLLLARLTGKPAPSWADDEVTLADLRARVAKAKEHIQTYSAADLEGSEQKTLTIKQRGEDVQVAALPHTLENAIPQIFFHLTVAYAILRHNGVPVGKRDFTG